MGMYLVWPLTVTVIPPPIVTPVVPVLTINTTPVCPGGQRPGRTVGGTPSVRSNDSARSISTLVAGGVDTHLLPTQTVSGTLGTTTGPACTLSVKASAALAKGS